LYIDKTSGLPIRIQEYGFPKHKGQDPPLLSDYTYLNIRTDLGLNSKHFDANHPHSGF
jgi:hypothetical protein